ncbi:MAG: helix-turn-helix domain-containing protein [Xanthomonadales bacterium]|nr:helix-turn-helix domain-containing protein [Xanthomonadales bacterium]
MHRIHEPGGALARHVECFWRWQRAPDRGSVEWILPDAAPELIVHLGEPPDVRGADGRWQRQPRAVVYCAARQCVALRYNGPMDLFAVRFRPWGFARFASLPMAGLLDRAVLLVEAMGAAGEELEQVIRSARDEDARVVAAAAWLGSALETPHPLDAPLAGLVDALGAAADTPSEMAACLSVSPRTVNRAWQRLVGMPPGQYAKLMRVHRALEQVREGQPLARVAQECGYADQAHLARHVRDVAGLPPSRLRDWLGAGLYDDLYRARDKPPWRVPESVAGDQT